jgi:hypothetical protein
MVGGGSSMKLVVMIVVSRLLYRVLIEGHRIPRQVSGFDRADFVDNKNLTFKDRFQYFQFRHSGLFVAVP